MANNFTLGFKKDSLIVLLSSFLVLHTSSYAFAPKTGQIIRFQPNLLRNATPFSVEGTLLAPSGSSSYVLEWFAPQTYQVTLKDLPRTFFSHETPGGNSLVLTRHPDSGCSLKMGRSMASCSDAEFWAKLELSGSSAEVAHSLVDANFIESSDAIYKENNRKEDMPLRTPQVETPAASHGRVDLVLSEGLKQTSAVLEIKGPSFKKTDSGGYPALQYDQTFLAPVQARFQNEGDFVQILAQQNFIADRKFPRFTPVISSLLEVYVDKRPLLKIARKLPVPQKNSRVAPRPSKTIADLSNIRDQLSAEGRDFLRAFLMTH